MEVLIDKTKAVQIKRINLIVDNNENSKEVNLDNDG